MMNVECRMMKQSARAPFQAGVASSFRLLSSFVRNSAYCLPLLLLAACGPLPGKPTAADIDIEPKAVRDFATLYRLNCAGCHGADGQGNGAFALANPVWLAIASDDVIRQAAAKGVPGTLMPAFAHSAGGLLVDEQIEILVQGIRAWAKPAALQGVTPPPYAAGAQGDKERGAAVFASHCVSCHGADGKGTAKVGSIVDGSYLALVSDQSLRNTLIAGRPEHGHPDWRGYSPNAPLSDQQITDVVAWLTAQRPATPGQPYTQTP